MWEAGQREKNSGRKRARMFQLKSEGKRGASRKKQSEYHTRCSQGVIPTAGSSIGTGSVARARG